MLNEIYSTVESAFHSGFGLLEGEVGDIFHMFMMLALFSILLYALVSAIGGNVPSVPKDIIAWIIMIAAFGVVIDAAPTLMGKISDAMWELGLSTSGSATLTDIKDFDGMILSGVNIFKILFEKIEGISFWDGVEPLAYSGLVFAIGAAMAVMYGLLAIRMFFMMLLWLPLSMVAYICMPFALWSPTSFVAEGAFRFITGQALSILVFGLLSSAIFGLADGFNWNADVRAFELSGLVVSTCAMFFITMKAPSIIGNCFAGGSHNDIGNIGHTIRTVMMATSAIGSMGSMVMSAISSRSGGGSPSSGPSTPPTNPGILDDSGTANTGTGGGQFRQPNARRP